MSSSAYKLFGRLDFFLTLGVPFFGCLLIAINYHRVDQERNRDKSILLASLVFIMSITNIIINDIDVNIIFIACYILQSGVSYLCYCHLQGDIIDTHVRKGGTLVSEYHTVAYSILFGLFFFAIIFLIKQV